MAKSKGKGGAGQTDLMDQQPEQQRDEGNQLAESPAVSEPGAGELDQAIENLGAAVAREEGGTEGLDLSEEAHRTAIERMEGLGDDLVLHTDSLICRVRDFVIDMIKARPKPWSATSSAEQRDVAAACEQLATGLIREIVELIRADGKDPVRVLLTKVALGDDIQITGKVKPMSEDEEDMAVMLLHHARGKHVLLTVASVDDYRGQHSEAAIEPDQGQMPFEAGEDELDEDEDWSDFNESEQPASGDESGGAVDTRLKTGDQLVVDGHDGLHEIEINLKTGMVEATPLDGSPMAKFDLREATPDELAAERERVADFNENELVAE